MAETLGSLYDKYSIAYIRFEAVAKQVGQSKNIQDKNDFVNLLILVNDQRDALTKEINDFMESAKNGDPNIKLKEPKYKIYKGEESSNIKFENIHVAICSLLETNQILWNLEDSRRDKSKHDHEIRRICDDVAKYNRLRNDTIDQINTMFSLSVHHRNTQ